MLISMRSILVLVLFVSVNCFGQKADFDQEIVKINDTLYEVSHGEHFVVDTKHVLVKLKTSVKKLPDNIKQVSETKSGIIEVEVPENQDVVKYVKELKDSEHFESVEYISNCNVYFSPNDIFLSSQNEYLDAIKAYDAWNYTKGSPSIKVAIIDTWIKKNHEDIGYGSDNNNYSNISNTLGYDYMGHSPNPTPDDIHGTGVAGVIGAKSNNYKGVAGISGGKYCQGVTMISYCLVNDYGAGAPNYMADAIRQAVDDGSRVINISLGHSENAEINSALYYAETHGVTVVCAAGYSTDTEVPYPASNPYTIAVGALNVSTSQAHYLGAGLDMVAPCTVYTTSNGAVSYISMSGTSFAAPQVTGTIALMLSVNPYLTPAKIRSILRNTATKVPGYSYDNNGWNGYVGHGMLNTLAAVINAMDLKIDGPQLIASNYIYHIDNLPSGTTVEWAISDSYYNDYHYFVPNYSGQGTCRIIRNNSHDLMNGTLTANIKYNGVIIRTLTTSNLYAYAGFWGQYTSGGLSGNINSSGYFNIKKNSFTTITSPNFYGATVSYSSSGATPSSWSFNSSTGVLSFYVSNITIPVILNVHDGCGNDYVLYAYPSSSYSINVSNGESGITVTLVEDGDVSKDFTPDEPWTIEIINTESGRVMTTLSSTNRSETISTAGWPKGIYIVKVTVGKEELTEKVMVK